MTITPFPHQSSNRELREAVQSLCARYSLDYWDSCDLEHRYPREFFDDFVALGLCGTLIPEEYGGGGGTIADMVTVLEEVGAGGGGLNACSSVHLPQFAVPVLLAVGTEEQRRTYLPKIAAGELFVTFGVTEPDAGTETTKISTKAVKTDGGWIINGKKVWNSGALEGHKVLLVARTSTPGPGERRGSGLTLFLADLQSENIDIRPIPKIGRNAVASAELFLRDVFVSDDDVVGTVGEGFYHLLHGLNGERLYIAAEMLGVGRWAIENASRYANERVVFGRPIGQNQAVAHPLAKAYLNLLAAGQVLYRAADEYLAKGGDAVGVLANSAKYLATEAAFAATDDAMQSFGGYSYAREYHIGRMWIESRIQRIAPISNQMILNYVSENCLQLPRSY